jgi:hypothetical protein
MATNIEQLIATLEAAKQDLTAAYAGKTKVSATRARKALHEIRALAQEARKEVLAISKGEQEGVAVNLHVTCED